MANNETFLQIPNDVDDPIVLRRILDNIVIAIDEIRGDRGNSAMASKNDLNGAKSSLVSTASNLSQLVDDFNAMDNNFLRIDGKNVARAPLSYDKKLSLSGLNFATMDELKKLKDQIKPKPAPAKLAGDVDPANISAKVDAIIDTLVQTKVFT